MANLYRTTRLQTAWTKSGRQSNWHAQAGKPTAASAVDKKAARKRKKAARQRKARGG